MFTTCLICHLSSLTSLGNKSLALLPLVIYLLVEHLVHHPSRIPDRLGNISQRLTLQLTIRWAPIIILFLYSVLSLLALCLCKMEGSECTILISHRKITTSSSETFLSVSSALQRGLSVMEANIPYISSNPKARKIWFNSTCSCTVKGKE